MQVSRKIKGILLTVAVSAVALLLFIAAWLSKTVSFDEEVLLSDGRRIVVKRSEHLARACEGFSCDWSLEKARIQLTLPGRNAPLWEAEHLQPVLLDMDGAGRIVIVALPATCGEHVRLNKPVPPYIHFELDGAAWKRTPPLRALHGREANLLIAPDWRDGEPALVQLAAKTERNRSPGLMPVSRRINLDLTGFC
jgi:hypothetical protein